MAVQVIGRPPLGGNDGKLFARLFRDAFALMRERWVVYTLFACICAGSAFNAFEQKISLLDVAAYHPDTLIRIPPVNVILLLALVAIFFVLPSALRRIDANFKMTFWRCVLTLAVLLCVSLLTDVGLAAAVVPGLIVGVLLSQALIAALLSTPASASARTAAASLLASIRGSYCMTKTHFATTAGIWVLSIGLVVVPVLVMLFAMFVFAYEVPTSLVFMAPLTFLTFIYLECVRYTLVVRWYQRLRGTADITMSSAP